MKRLNKILISNIIADIYLSNGTTLYVLLLKRFYAPAGFNVCLWSFQCSVLNNRLHLYLLEFCRDCHRQESLRHCMNGKSSKSFSINSGGLRQDCSASPIFCYCVIDYLMSKLSKHIKWFKTKHACWMLHIYPTFSFSKIKREFVSILYYFGSIMSKTGSYLK